MDKGTARKKRGKKTRKRIATLRIKRMSVHRSAKHIYVQIFDEKLETVIAAASTVDKELQIERGKTGNTGAAKKVGELIAKRALEKGVGRVAFDRGGLKFHGRIKALAEAARQGGLEF